MSINLPIKKNPNTDAQRQGHVGYNDDTIYPKDSSGKNPYVIANQDSNATRVKSVFGNNFTSMSSLEISKAMLLRLDEGEIEDNFNPDFGSSSVSYNYDIEQISADKNRGEDLFLSEEEAGSAMTDSRRAPNVSISASEYVAPFKSDKSNGGFGNNALTNSLHKDSNEGKLDSLEVFEKYQ